MRALLFVALFGINSCLSCPQNYDLVESGECIRKLFYGSDYLDHLLPDSRAKCVKDGARLPIIKNDKENEIFNRLVNAQSIGTYLVLDLTCNYTSRRLEWIDGTEVNYIPWKSNINLNFDCYTSSQTIISRPSDDMWYLKHTYDTWVYVVYCVIEPTATTASKYSTVVNNRTSWNQAQRKCSSDFASLITINSDEENKFFVRAAVSNNILEGMHIGAHQSPYDSNVWIWTDSEMPLDGNTYNNFISVFPIPGGGECTSMLTGSSEAYWINENCDQNMQAYMCRRADFSTLSKICPTDAPMAGEDFYPPGFPNSNIPCAYMLFVAANKRVELEVITLVADINKDFLEILEGTSGAHLLANLTGTILTPAKFMTVTSNVLRVNWAPGGSGSGRGFRIRYNQVDA